MGEAFDRRLTVVMAPAGSGKTTLLARFASTCGAPVAWYRAESWDADERSFVRHLEVAIRAAIPEVEGGWTVIDDAVRSLASLRSDHVAGPGVPEPVVLVIDDFHTLEDTPAEAAFGRLVDHAPAWLTLVLGTRVAPGLPLSRLRVAGDLLEIETEDLRFRAWEVEQLFREVYHDPVPPADLAVLARRTEGWAAGLQLFHLAARGRSTEERRRLLGGPGSSGRLLREYLAQNVMVGLPPELRSFLLETCVLGRLSGPLCDRLRGAAGSGALLDELARRGIFTVPVEDGSDAYRYHEVLRGHLDRMLVEEVGEAEARRQHARAALLLEDSGALPEALRAYSRAEEWDAVTRMLGGQGEHLAAAAGARWIEELPPAIERHDPWVALAAARRARNEGRWTAALAAYAHAEAAFGPARAAEVPHAERQALAAWMDSTTVPHADAPGLLRSGLVRDPGAAGREAVRLGSAAGEVVRGLLALAAGEVAVARRILVRAAEDGEGGAMAMAAARLGAAVAGVLAGEPWDGRAFQDAIDSAERGGIAWLARLGRGLERRLGPAGPVTAAARELAPDGSLVDASGRLRDGEERWSSALLDLAAAWSPAGDAETALAAAEAATAAFRALGAGALEAIARSLEALASAHLGLPDAQELAVSAGGFGRSAGTAGARSIAHAALAESDPRVPPEPAAQGGMRLPAWAHWLSAGAGVAGRSHAAAGDGHAGGGAPAPAAEGATGPAGLHVRLLGGCSLEIDGRRLSLDGAKPRVRSLFRLLALHVGAPVHREVIADALWPDADGDAAARSLHVALSALRRGLDEALPPDGSRLLVREGDAYRLDVAADAVDLGRFDLALGAGRAARARGETSAGAFGRAVDLYAGDVLPEEGSAAWVAERRAQYRARAVEAAEGLAADALLAGDTATAIRACRFGLEIDRCQDSLWRMLISARERAGEAGAASRDRREYALVLEALGVTGGATGLGVHR